MGIFHICVTVSRRERDSLEPEGLWKQMIACERRFQHLPDRDAVASTGLCGLGWAIRSKKNK